MFKQKKSSSRPSSGPKKRDLDMIGGLGMNVGIDPMTMEMFGDGNENDDDLEAELAALQGGQPQQKQRRPKRNLMDISSIDAMAAECMKDIDYTEDEDINDPDLLAELDSLTPFESTPSLDGTPVLLPTKARRETVPGKEQPKQSGGDVAVITERKAMYETAIANAEKAGDGGKARRFKRGLKTIEKMLKTAQSGKEVNMDELPPQVATGGSKPAAPTQSSVSETPPMVTPRSTSSRVPSEATNNDPKQPPAVPSKPVRTPIIPLVPPRTPPDPTKTPLVPPRTPPDPSRTPTVPPRTPSDPSRTPTVPPRTPPDPSRTPTVPPRTQPVSPMPPQRENDSKLEETLKGLILKRDQYKLAARNCNRSGDKENAKKYLIISKDFDVVIQAVKDGKDVDLTQCPPPPPGFPGGQPVTSTNPKAPQVSRAQTSSTALLVSDAQTSSLPPQISGAQTSPTSEESGSSPGQPSAPKTILEALEQRLEKYQSGVNDAEKEGNSSKARRMKRIVKQYQDAIRNHKAKKPVSLDELPTPPGYPPFPVDTPKVSTQTAASAQSASNTHRPPQPAAKHDVQRPTISQAPPKPAPPKGRNEKELKFLLDRQKQFQKAALEAKKKGDIDTARNHLRKSKGFDSMIEAARNGLRVDLSKIPEPPTVTSHLPESISAAGDFVVVHESDCTPETRDRDEIFGDLEKALKSQYEMCKNNTQHYSKMGDIENSKRFEKLAINCRHDYDSLQSSFKHGNPPPRYHYENRTFHNVRSNTDLGDQDCELRIVKCINIPLPSGYNKDDMKVYVFYEFPFPNDQPQTGFTETIKHNINPEFDQKFKISIDRKNRSLARIFRRQSVKFEIKYNRGFLKGDKTLGQASLKLSPFDNRCEIHECLNLMDPEKGRKAIGGKIEVKLRIREPLTDKDVEILTQKWLVIDAFVAPTNRPISASSTSKLKNPENGRKAKNSNQM